MGSFAKRGCLSLLAVILGTSLGFGGEIRIAVASNFSAAMEVVARRFEEQTGHTLVLMYGSTGVHYAQIVNGAPIHAFFAADAERPTRLEREGRALRGTRFTYALGRLVLWSPRPGLVDDQGRVLGRGAFRYLALANPRLAPYGLAARQVLERMDLWNTLQSKIVRGENVSQTYQFVSSGNAELGFVAYSQIVYPGHVPRGSYWIVPTHLHEPIVQQAVLLKDDPIGRRFLAFWRRDDVRAIIESFGYAVP